VRYLHGNFIDFDLEPQSGVFVCLCMCVRLDMFVHVYVFVFVSLPAVVCADMFVRVCDILFIFFAIFQMNIEGDNLICACLQGISQNLRRASSHESNVKYISTLESLFRTWFGASIEDEYRKWCEHLNHGRGVHADIFYENSDFVFRDRAFWRASALDYLNGHIEKNIRRFADASKKSLVLDAASAATGSVSVCSLLMKEDKDVLQENDVRIRCVEAHSLHSGYPICVSAGPQLSDSRHILAIAFEDLTMQIVEFKQNTSGDHSVKVLNTTRFAPPKPVPVQLEIDVGSRVRLSEKPKHNPDHEGQKVESSFRSVSQEEEEEEDGPLPRGKVGVVDMKDDSSLPYHVDYEGNGGWYTKDALVAETCESPFFVPVTSCSSDTIFCSAIVSFEEGMCIEFVGELFGGLSKKHYFVHKISRDRLSFLISSNSPSDNPLELLSGPANAHVRIAGIAPFIQWAPSNIPILSRESEFLVTPLNPRIQVGAALFFTECEVNGIENDSIYLIKTVEIFPTTMKFSIFKPSAVNLSRGTLGTIRLQSNFYLAVNFSDSNIFMCSFSWSSNRSKTPWESNCVDSYLSVKSCCIDETTVEDEAPVAFTCCAWGYSQFAFASRSGKIHVCSVGSPENFSFQMPDSSFPDASRKMTLNL
jgi:hypothetical protein